MGKVAKFGILALLLVVGSAIAFGGFGSQAARDAMESGNYAAWKEAMTSALTEKRFNQMRERHSQMQEKRAEIETAMQQGYQAWKEVAEKSPRGERLADVITEENFDRFVEMHNLMKSGEHDAAKEIAKELGIEGAGMCGKGKFGGRMS